MSILDGCGIFRAARGLEGLNERADAHHADCIGGGAAMKTPTKLKRPKRPTVTRRRGAQDDNLRKQLDQRTQELAEARKHLAEALEQQTATSKVLQVISSSPGELGAVFEAMLENATRICEANFGMMLRFENGTARPVALLGVPQAYVEFVQRGGHKPSEHAPVMRVAKTKQIVHVADFSTEHPYAVERNPFAVAGVEIAGIRTLLVVPMLKENELLGAIAIYRQDVRPFTDKQIALVQNFANQAVIAIDNTRLLNELRQRTGDLSEALEQQTATSEILRVISGSPTDVRPIFDAIVRSASRLCGGEYAIVTRYDGELLISPRSTIQGLAPLTRQPNSSHRFHAVRHRSQRARSSTPPWFTSRISTPRNWDRRHARHIVGSACELSSPCRWSMRVAPSGSSRFPAGHRAPLGSSDRSAPNVRRPGGDRDRERAAFY